MIVRHRLVVAALAALGISLFVSACISVRARDLRDLAVQQAQCAARDGSTQCACWSKCVSEETDCHCADE